jgi:hypothetical protein
VPPIPFHVADARGPNHGKLFSPEPAIDSNRNVFPGRPFVSKGWLVHNGSCCTSTLGRTMRTLIFLLLGIPIPVVIIAWFITGHA